MKLHKFIHSDYKEEKQSKSSSGIDADERVFGTPSEHRSRNVVLSPLGPELRSVSTNEGGLTRDLKLPMVDREEAEKWLPAGELTHALLN